MFLFLKFCLFNQCLWVGFTEANIRGTPTMADQRPKSPKTQSTSQNHQIWTLSKPPSEESIKNTNELIKTTISPLPKSCHSSKPSSHNINHQVWQPITIITEKIEATKHIINPFTDINPKISPPRSQRPTLLPSNHHRPILGKIISYASLVIIRRCEIYLYTNLIL